MTRFFAMLHTAVNDLRVGWCVLDGSDTVEWRERDARALADLQAQATAQPYEKEFFRKDASRCAGAWGRRAVSRTAANEVVAFVLE